MPYLGTQPNNVKQNTGLYTPSEILEFDNAEVMHTFYNGKTEEKEPVIVLYFTDKAIFELENLLGQIYDTAINCNAKDVKKTIVQYK